MSLNKRKAKKRTKNLIIYSDLDNRIYQEIRKLIMNGRQKKKMLKNAITFYENDCMVYSELRKMNRRLHEAAMDIKHENHSSVLLDYKPFRRLRRTNLNKAREMQLGNYSNRFRNWDNPQYNL